MAQQILNNSDGGLTFRTKLNNNFTDLYVNKAPNNHASTAVTYGVASNILYGHVKVTPGNGLINTNGTININLASTTAAGTVQLIDNATSTSTSQAPTANALKVVSDSAIKTYSGTTDPTTSLGKDGDIYFKIT